MPDAAHRTLEREALSDPSAQAALIRRRIRSAAECERCRGLPLTVECPACVGAGSVYAARVHLAAYCHDPAACSALGLRERCDCFGRGHTVDEPTGRKRIWHADRCGAPPIGRWVAKIARWRFVDQAILVRTAVAAARSVLPLWEKRELDDQLTIEADGKPVASAYDVLNEEGRRKYLERLHLIEPRLAIEATEKWLNDQSDERLRAAMEALRLTAYFQDPRIIEGTSAWWRQLSNLLQLDECLAPAACLEGAVTSAVEQSDHETRVRLAIRDALVPWALECS